MADFLEWSNVYGLGIVCLMFGNVYLSYRNYCLRQDKQALLEKNEALHNEQKVLLATIRPAAHQDR